MGIEVICSNLRFFRVEATLLAVAEARKKLVAHKEPIQRLACCV